MQRDFIFTSESVTEGHPDKLCDQVSDAVLDAVLAADPMGRVACETLATTGLVFVTGEISTETYVDIPSIARQVVLDIGYDGEGFDGKTCAVLTAIDEQSPDISGGVSSSMETRDGGQGDELDTLGAGDQGLMFGYASSETDSLMPLPLDLAHRLCRRLTEVRRLGGIDWLRPDGKSQVSIRYQDFKPVAVETVLVSTQHAEGPSQAEIHSSILREVIEPVLPDNLSRDGMKVYVNPSGKFVRGGPEADAGLTGRKIIVDTYGGFGHHGGGAFSGKDPTKVDRSASYAARWVAKNVVAAHLAERFEIQIAYAIGVAHPLSININTYGTHTVDPAKIQAAIDEHFDLRPAAIIRDLDLRRPLYRQVAAYGHFGRDDLNPPLPWESTDKADLLRASAGL